MPDQANCFSIRRMALIDMKVDFDPLVEGVGLLQEQLPFAIARTLTLCARRNRKREPLAAPLGVRSDCPYARRSQRQKFPAAR